MRKLLQMLLLTLFTIVTIVRVDYITVPTDKGYREEIRITFTDSIMQVPRDRGYQDIIPYGKCKMTEIKEMSGRNTLYKFYKVEE